LRATCCGWILSLIADLPLDELRATMLSEKPGE
jgi:hypothetical protein